MSDGQFVFAPFRLDPDGQQLWRDEELIPLRPKIFAVLQRLVEAAGRLVTREDLRAAVWPTTAVSESVVRGTIRELREALGDDAAAVRFIETVPHRGYRFIAPVTVSRAVSRRNRSAPAALPAAARESILIGRDGELATLDGLLDLAVRGARQTVFVTGEPGIGKTTLVDAFLAAAGEREDVATARGQCVEHYGTGEPYLPVLEALGQLCRGPRGPQAIAVMGRHAPTWLAQMPAVIGDAELDGARRRAQGATRERMLRELAEALEVLTAETGLVVVLEDLHWSDYSTLDLLSLVAQRREPARLLIVGTYRPVDVIVSGHPLRALHQQLRVHGQCQELPLRFLTDDEVGEYLAARFPGQQLPAALRHAIHRSTEGNPLFLVTVVDYWLSQRVLVETAGRWQLAGRIDDVAAGVPDNLRHMIEKQLDRCAAEELRVLEAASVAGVEFPSALVAAVLDERPEHVEDCCDALTARVQFLRGRGTEVLGDGAVTGRYAFRHALYQQVLYERVPAARRVRLHRRIAEWQEHAYARRGGEIAAELAMHFERAYDAARAVQYLTAAGEAALRRSAHPEAIRLLTRGLDLLLTMPDTPERARQELALRATLGATLAVTQGYASPDVEQAHGRAFELCQRIGETPQLFPVLAGLWGFRFLRAELHTANELAAQLFRVARSTGDPALLLWADTLVGITRSMLGELPTALGHLEEGIALYDPRHHGPDRTQVGAQDPKVTCLSFAAWTQWRLGYPDQARARIGEAIAWARELAHPFSLAVALDFAGAGVGMFLRDVDGVELHARALIELCREHGFPYWLAWGDVRQGWVLRERGEVEAGIARMREGMDSLRKTGAELSLPYNLAQLAEAHGKQDRADEGLRLLSRALALVEQTGERWYEAELHRLRGELLRQTDADAAEACFDTAMRIAASQQAKSLELRAAISLSRLWQRQRKQRPARALLGDVYGWFTEGFDTADLQEARSLLDEL